MANKPQFPFVPQLRGEWATAKGFLAEGMEQLNASLAQLVLDTGANGAPITSVEHANTANVAETANNALHFDGKLPEYFTNGANIITGTVDAARLPAANTTANGIVTTANQSFAGEKTFTDNLFVKKTRPNIALAFEDTTAKGYLSAHTANAVVATYNLNYDGAWNLDDTDKPGSIIQVHETLPFSVWTSAAGSNPRTPTRLLHVGADGNVGSDTQPRCVAYRANTQVVAHGTWTALAWTNYRSTQVGGMHSTSVNPSRFTITAPGLYFIHGWCTFAASASGSVRAVRVTVNGTQQQQINYPNAQHATSIACPRITMILALNANDYVELWGWQDTGGNLNSGLISSGVASECMIVKLW